MMLADMQRDFQSWLTTASDDAAQRLGNGAMAGLSVYQNNYRAQLVGCLEESFPRIRTWLGEDAFLQAAISHIGTHAPHSWTLDAYPGNFNETLQALYPNNPDLHELAWIELALSDAFVAPDAAPLSLEALSTIDWDTARLQLTPSFTSHVATTNAESIWSSLWQESTPPDSEMLTQPGGLIVWRRQYTSCLKEVDSLEYDALLHLRNNGEFAALCDMLVERLGHDEGVARAGALLAGWLGSELIVGVEENSSTAVTNQTEN